MTEKKRLLVLASTYPRWRDDPEPGFVHELSRRLADDFEVFVLCPHAPGAKVRERMDGVDVHRYRYAPAALETLVNNGGVNGNLKKSPWKWLLVPCFLFSQWWHTLQLIQRLKPDVVHAHWIIPQGLILYFAHLFTVKAPYVVTSHGADLFTLKGGMMTRLKSFILRQAAFITVVSEPMRQQALRLGITSDRIAVMPMGVDFDKFTPDCDVARNPNEILFVGRLVEKKGLAYLIRAMPLVRRKVPSACLSVIGFGPVEEALRKLVIELGLSDCVDFLGPKPQADLIQYYRRAALFVAPFVEAKNGDQEGLGLVTIEAAACGCPVLVGDVLAVTGLPVRKVDVTDINAFASRLLEMLEPHSNDDCSDLRQMFQDAFDWQNVSKAYAKILTNMAAPP